MVSEKSIMETCSEINSCIDGYQTKTNVCTPTNKKWTSITNQQCSNTVSSFNDNCIHQTVVLHNGYCYLTICDGNITGQICIYN